MVGVRSQRVVYLHLDNRWPPQPSVKGVRRAMCTFFSRKRHEQRTLTNLSDGLFGSLAALESADHDPHRAGVELLKAGANRGEAADEDDEGAGGGGVRRLAGSEAGASDGVAALRLCHSSLSDGFGSVDDADGLRGLDLAAFVESALPSDDEGGDEAIREEDIASLADADAVKVRRVPPFRARPRALWSITSAGIPTVLAWHAPPPPPPLAAALAAPSSLWAPRDGVAPPPRRSAVPPRPRLPGQVRLEADGLRQDRQDGLRPGGEQVAAASVGQGRAASDAYLL